MKSRGIPWAARRLDRGQEQDADVPNDTEITADSESACNERHRHSKTEYKSTTFLRCRTGKSARKNADARRNGRKLAIPLRKANRGLCRTDRLQGQRLCDVI
jgi:hypothetical protein